MGIFSKINFGLTKTRNKMAGAIDDLLDSVGEINDDLYTELEELLVMHDVGVQTSLEIIEELRKRVPEKKIKNPTMVKDEIKEIVAEKLYGGEDMGLITIPSILFGKPDNISRQALLIIWAFGFFALQSSALPQSRTRTTLRNTQLLLHKNYSFPPPLRAGQNFPVETSFKMRLSRLKSATTRFRRAFSCSRSFRRRA